ncbi:MAG: sulfatase [Lachnospiraceae bacterium]|nr:sulfatase [Lachnospiraceae bacterium]
MKAIMVMFDSLNRHMLESYGCDWTNTPGFVRLAEHSTQFENCYVGSMPCMPARRELHTGRPNFLHRSWGPLEPFDDSMPEILKNAGICTHLVSDHQHYWEDGGGTYHTRYSSWECIRGQEGDPWKENLCMTPDKRSVFASKEQAWKIPLFKAMNTHDQVNRSCMCEERLTPQAMTFKNGLEFIDVNYEADNWFLQIEEFDPHEPFFCEQKYKEGFEGPLHGEDALGSDWPPYMPVRESEKVIQTVRNNYAALLKKCDTYLGMVLDKMDEYHLWSDTMLIVCTDHGFLLGEHGWWGKTAMPCYNEIAHTPLYVWDPRFPEWAGKKAEPLVQMMDFAPTILEFFGQPIPKDMMGKPIRNVFEKGERLHEYVVFGFHGAEIIVTDGKYLFMNAPEHPEDPYFEYTLMPTHMRARFCAEELKSMELAEAFSFTKGLKTLKIRCRGSAVGGSNEPMQSRLFDIEEDPEQLTEIRDDEIIAKMKGHIREYMIAVDAPEELYHRYGI